MKKLEFFEAISEKAGATKKDVAEIFEAALEIIVESVAKGDEINIMGFGKFTSSDRAERKGRDPRSGKEIIIPARKVVSFKAGKEFKDQVNSAS